MPPLPSSKVTYAPNVARPFPGDDTWNIEGILKEVKQGCPAGEKKRAYAQELKDWYEGDSEKFISFKPSEDSLSWLTRPKRVSFITRQAVNKLTSHLYKPGPRTRRVTADDQVDAWYRRVAQDLNLNAVMKRADQLVHLQNICALGLYPTGDARRPVNYHLYERTEFDVWCNPADPRDPIAVCTITKIDDKTTRYRLWTRHAYYTWFKSKAWGYQAGGWGTARYDPASSGEHGYGCLPFVILTHELPTTELETKGLGCLFSKVNKALNIDMSNLALWVHLYAKPVPWAAGCGVEWRPKFVDGGFLILPAVVTSTESDPSTPAIGYLQANLDIAAVWQYIRGQANASLAEIDVPLTTTVQSDGGGGTMGASGLSIVAQDADLITYAKARQPTFERHESKVCALACRIGAAEQARQPDAFRLLLTKAAEDPSLRVVWPEIYSDVPSRDRDDSDTWELENDLTDPIELLMKRQGLTEIEAIDSFTAVQGRKARALKIIALAQAAADAPDPTDHQPKAPELPDGSDVGPGPRDMGIPGPVGPSTATPASNGVNPSLTVSVGIEPTADIPAGGVILAGTPGYGGWGTGM